MSEWIKTSERLPEQNAHCWICEEDVDYPNGKLVYDGFFDNKSSCIVDGKLVIQPGWEYNTEYSSYVPATQITHWKEYFTPEPPNE